MKTSVFLRVLQFISFFLMLLASTSSFASDVDEDGINDSVDLCIGLSSTDNEDIDGDGKANPCDRDDDGDGYDDWYEIKIGTMPHVADMDGDNIVDSQDESPLTTNYTISGDYYHTCALDDSNAKTRTGTE